MKKITDVKFEDILPESLKNDDIVRALSRGIEDILGDWNSEIVGTILYKNLDSLPQELINLLIWEWHIDFIDENITLGEKRDLLKNNWGNHFRKGTPDAVENVLKSIFGDADLREWFEYGGDPYKFKVIASGQIPHHTVVERLLKVIELYKNERSHFEGFTISQVDNGRVCFGGATVNSGRRIDRQVRQSKK